MQPEKSAPRSKPRISLSGWGPPKDATFPATMKRGFYLVNHGDTALEITVETFKVGTQSAYGETLSEIGAEKEGFTEILVDRKGPLFKYALDQTLDKEVDVLINSSELAYLQPLKIPVSVTYRDFENIWYRTACDLVYKKGQITFSAPMQTTLDSKPPKV